jgi:hypothetical protein
MRLKAATRCCCGCSPELACGGLLRCLEPSQPPVYNRQRQPRPFPILLFRSRVARTGHINLASNPTRSSYAPGSLATMGKLAACLLLLCSWQVRASTLGCYC